MFQALYELLFPPTCPVCQQAKPAFHGFLCLGCLADLSFSLRPKGIQPVEKAFWGRVPVHSAYSWLRFNPQNRTRDLLHAIKYDQDERLGQAMGRRFGRDLLSVIHDPPDLILPVPLHAKKMKRRGFNQAEAIAKGMSEVLKIPINSTLLSRTEHQASLTKLSRIDRWERIRSAYQCQSELLTDVHYMVVDDVITTGATIEACVNALLEAGAKKVSVASLAYAERQF